MVRVLCCALVGVLLVAFSAAASAGIPDPDLSRVDLGPDLCMASCPAGDGPAFEYITVTAKRSDASPIQGIPYTCFFFTVTGGDVTITHVDEETGAVGEIRFDMVADETIVLFDPEFLTIRCQIYTVVLNDIDYLEVTSFDINQDGCVDLRDFAMFSSIFLTSDKRGDFDCDGHIGLADFAMFAAHYLHGDCD